jgi:iron complex transport system ATP-binding protein
LDYPSKVEVLQLLSHISRQANKTIFLSTHDVELALQLADTIWLMTRESGMTIGTPQQLAQQGALARFIERDGIVFDAETLSIRIVKK